VNFTSRFGGLPGFRGTGLLFWLPKLFECCRLVFFVLFSHVSFDACNDNWFFNVIRVLLLLLFNVVLLLSTNIFVLLDERWLVLSREATTNGVSTTTFCGRISSLSNV